MALKAGAFLLFLSSVFQCINAAPLDAPQAQATTEAPILVTQVVTSSIEVFTTSTVLAPAQPTVPILLPLPVPDTPAFPISSAPVPSPATPTPPPVVTDIITETATTTPPPVTVIVSAPPATVTQTITTTPPASTTTGVQNAWSAPPQITDLSVFNVKSFPYGQNNMALVSDIPSEASATTDPTAQATPEAGMVDTLPSPENSSTILQLLYPAGSINPESSPQGGADFYATPLDITSADNVTLEYSVFFPVDFDWVLAGKLPGLYGGHTTCSGGDDALSCFSTRLMWRAKGAGELYLYAPKDKQTEALCAAPPLSVCDQEYGLSIGRGSFSFTPGAWTHIRQTVALNTPGVQDGGFILEVNGQEVMRRNDVFYRDVMPLSEPSGDGKGGEADGDGGANEDEPDAPDADSGSGDGKDHTGTKIKPAEPDPSPDPNTSPNAKPSASPPPPAQAPGPPPPTPGLIGSVPILGPLLNGLGSSLIRLPRNEQDGDTPKPARRDDMSRLLFAGPDLPAFIVPPAQMLDVAAVAVSVTSTVTETVAAEAVTQTILSQPTTTAIVYVDASQALAEIESAIFQQSNPEETPKPVGFSGLFFSTFFGGHDDKYATPKDQYTWFKDFAMTINE